LGSPDCSGAQGLTTAEMKSAQTYQNAGWSITTDPDTAAQGSTTWMIYDGKSYPVLTRFQVPAYVKPVDENNYEVEYPVYLNEFSQNNPIPLQDVKVEEDDQGRLTITDFSLPDHLDYQTWLVIPKTLEVEEPVQPVEEPAQPVEEPAQPVEEPAQPVEEPVQPVEEPVQPVEEPVQPVEEPTQPVEEPVQPVEEPAQPVEEPVEEPVQPVEEPAQPVEEPTEPIEEPAEIVRPLITEIIYAGEPTIELPTYQIIETVEPIPVTAAPNTNTKGINVGGIEYSGKETSRSIKSASASTISKTTEVQKATYTKSVWVTPDNPKTISALPQYCKKCIIPKYCYCFTTVSYKRWKNEKKMPLPL